MVFRPPRLAPLLLGLGAVLVALGFAGLGLYGLLAASISLWSFFLGFLAFLLLIAAGLAAWRTYACWGMCYHLNRDGLTIRWGYRKVVVPLADIGELVASDRKPVKWSGGIHWYAYHVGLADVESLGPTRFYATHLSPSRLVYVQAAGDRYAISLKNPKVFARYLETCRGLGSLSRRKSGTDEGSLASLQMWSDPWALGLLVTAFMINLALFAYLSHRFPSLSSYLSLHFAPTGQVDRIGEKLEIFKLPGMALVVLGGNSLASLVLHLRERYLALLALAVALLVQVLFWVAAVEITR